jgi:hypothetical protein
MRILGVTASGFFNGEDFELISTFILSSNTPSITFDVSSFASNYKHLQIRSLMRSTFASTWDSGSIRFNSDSGTNYANHALGGTGSGSPYSESGTSRSNIGLSGGALAASSLESNIFTGSILDILDPFSSTKNTTTREFSGSVASERRVRFGSGFWANTAPVTSIQLACTGNFIPGSRFSLYGIRG